VTLTLTQPWSIIDTAHRLIILDICAKLFVNPTRGSKDIERTRSVTDGQTDGRTDNGAKNNMSPHFMGERHNNQLLTLAYDTDMLKMLIKKVTPLHIYTCIV